jgi:hypothetical protein
MPNLRGTSYNDEPIRTAVIELYKKYFNTELIETDPNKKVIDLLQVNDPTYGVEVEHGKWKGNFWENDNYSLISGLEHRTINIPARKEKYWLEYFVRWGKERHNPSFEKNVFVRSNKDFTQFIIIESDVVRNEEKLIRTKFQPNNSDEVENWLSFKREHVKTYDLIDGELILQKTNEL